jgi:hypothetical protein
MKLLKKIIILTLAVLLSLLILPGLASCSKQPDISTNADEDVAFGETFDSDGANTAIAPIEEEVEIADPEIPLNEGVEDSAGDNPAKKDGFVFVYNGTSIYLGEYSERILGELGSAFDYEESDSCTSDGIMKTYYYGGFNFSTYIKDNPNETGKDRIFSIALTDDGVSTAEGIYIGQTVDEMIAVYGAEYEEMPGFYYRYNKNGVGLSFDVDDNIIIAVTYQLLNID